MSDEESATMSERKYVALHDGTETQALVCVFEDGEIVLRPGLTLYEAVCQFFVATKETQP